MNRTLIVGHGYLGKRVGRQAVAAGHTVYATSRDPSTVGPAWGGEVTPIRLDWTDRRMCARLPEVDRVLVAVSYDRTSRISRYDSQVGGLTNLLSVLPPNVDVCYISTTGVYHQTDGVWVDERSPTRPSREGGRVHLQAESMLHRMRPQSPWSILRLSGIYGPGRVPRAGDVAAGRPISIPGFSSHGGGHLNLIHVDDAATAVMAVWGRSDGSLRRRMYVVSDDKPTPRVDFYRRIAREIDAPDPVFIDPPADASTRMRSDGDKRVWNRRMKSELVNRLKYPTFREGLAQVMGGAVLG
ncbi:NAD dependent epimerase/dehydratase family protein [Rubripirellula tenax]|uniref:NAD dependent epimerase/dehydratase family protein n=1 Tax=Rubripirellula tenax TaxID=2528015 RepID=A0A5C6EJL9_9BACT|nr:NAD-dependent epimerase/dehydratase family protein [Rubripirellula tenax]TWU47479.1 NAD dependent epimerase/dehydratase family protein [Rubripirellula tenax]